jgi:(2Fe-2S) ferredoxin
MKYPFEKLLLVCSGARCNDLEKNGENRGDCLQELLKEVNKARGRKPTVRVVRVSCLDLCDHGPNLVVHPSGTTYGHLDRAKALAVYEGEMGDGPPRPDLELDL